MEIGHSRHLKCFKCKKVGHTARNCKAVNQVIETRIDPGL